MNTAQKEKQKKIEELRKTVSLLKQGQAKVKEEEKPPKPEQKPLPESFTGIYTRQLEKTVGEQARNTITSGTIPLKHPLEDGLLLVIGDPTSIPYEKRTEIDKQRLDVIKTYTVNKLLVYLPENEYGLYLGIKDILIFEGFYLTDGPDETEEEQKQRIEYNKRLLSDVERLLYHLFNEAMKGNFISNTDEMLSEITKAIIGKKSHPLHKTIKEFLDADKEDNDRESYDYYAYNWDELFKTSKDLNLKENDYDSFIYQIIALELDRNGVDDFSDKIDPELFDDLMKYLEDDPFPKYTLLNTFNGFMSHLRKLLKIIFFYYPFNKTIVENLWNKKDEYTAKSFNELSDNLTNYIDKEQTIDEIEKSNWTLMADFLNEIRDGYELYTEEDQQAFKSKEERLKKIQSQQIVQPSMKKTLEQYSKKELIDFIRQNSSVKNLDNRNKPALLEIAKKI